jgi:hypothetical protein
VTFATYSTLAAAFGAVLAVHQAVFNNVKQSVPAHLWAHTLIVLKETQPTRRRRQTDDVDKQQPCAVQPDVFLFKPETLLMWHRELVWCK